MRVMKFPKFVRVSTMFASLASGFAHADSYDFAAEYTADLLSNVSGGIETGSRYLDNLDLTLEINVAEALGFGGGTLYMYGLYNNGTTFSDELVGDLQVVSNIDSSEAWRIYELWYEFGAERWSVRTGLYDLNSEFDTKESAAIFINSSHGIGADISQTGENGPGIFPVSALAVRAEFQLGNVTTRFVLLDGVPGDPDHSDSNAIDLSSNDGVLAVGEIETPSSNHGRLWAGYWHYTADAERPFDQTVQDGNNGWYIGAEREFKIGTRTAAGYLRYGRADSGFNPVETFLGLGIVVNAPLSHRPDDQLGLGVAIAKTGNPYQTAFSNAGFDAESHETAWELTYRAQINESFALQPDIQFVQNPASASTLDNAWIIGIRMQIAY